MTVRQWGQIGLMAALALAAGSCSRTSGPAPKLYIFNWTYYLPDDVCADFEKEFKARVVYDTYPSNEDMFAKLKAGACGYDVIFPSGDYVSIMIKEGMLEPIDRTLVPNLAYLDSMVLKKIKFDPGCRYSVPYMLGSAGVAVNKKRVKEYPRSWRIFERPDLKGRMTLLDDMREVLGAALATLGYPVNSTDPAQLAAAKAVVERWRENITKFDSDTFAKGFAAGEFYVVHCYAENVYKEYDSTRTDEIDFFIPPEGGGMYLDNMVIPKDARHRELAHQFINFVHRPDIFARICDFLRTPCLNTGARQWLEKEPIYLLEALAHGELKEDLGEHLELYDRLWQEIRIGR